MIVGHPPVDLGFVDITDPTANEQLFWLYCPIKTPKSEWVIPANLAKFQPIVDNVDVRPDDYVYITAKTMYVSGGCTGQRPGWHTDGFGSSDINYIWYTNNPTLFMVADPDDIGYYEVSDDHQTSMQQMAEIAVSRNPPKKVKYPCRHLLKLDQHVMHRPLKQMKPGIRTFVKISVSKQWYNLEGNSINHQLLDFVDIPHEKREDTRNHPRK